MGGGRGRGGFEVVRCCVWRRNERLGEEGEVGGEEVHLAGERRRRREGERKEGEGVLEVGERGKEGGVNRSDELDDRVAADFEGSGALERESKFSFRKWPNREGMAMRTCLWTEKKSASEERAKEQKRNRREKAREGGRIVEADAKVVKRGDKGYTNDRV